MRVTRAGTLAALFTLVFTLAGLTALNSTASAQFSTSGRRDIGLDARLDVGQLYSADNQTEQHLQFTDLRSTLDAKGRPVGILPLEFHFDARVRFPWNDTSAVRRDVTRLFVQYQDETDPWSLALGRMTLGFAGGAQVDGSHLDFGLGENARIGVFGGLLPHPITRDVDPRFLTAGVGYTFRSEIANHAGGVLAQWYLGSLDRAYVSERIYAQMSSDWTLFGQMTLDLNSDRGLFRKFDLTNGNLTIRYRPAPIFDVSLAGTHVHTLIPSLWWDDWIATERARLGFSIEGNEPVGTRRSSARMITNIHVTQEWTPYAEARYDIRHEDRAVGYEGRAGIKYSSFSFGYADLSVAYRRLFGSESRLASIQAGVEVMDGLHFDAGLAALRTEPLSDRSSGRPWMLYDVNGTVWFDGGAISPELAGAQVLGMYQAFVDPEMIYHVFYVRLGYRFQG